MRGISYLDCFDKESLAGRLTQARQSGVANPDLLNTFNRVTIGETFQEEKVAIQDNDIAAAMANDGTLPGGPTPELFKSLTENPEIMQLLQSTKMQEAMKLTMTGESAELQERLAADPELQATITKLNDIMGSLQRRAPATTILPRGIPSRANHALVSHATYPYF